MKPLASFLCILGGVSQRLLNVSDTFLNLAVDLLRHALRLLIRAPGNLAYFLLLRIRRTKHCVSVDLLRLCVLGGILDRIASGLYILAGSLDGVACG